MRRYRGLQAYFFILPFSKQAILTKPLFPVWRGWRDKRNFQRILEAAKVIQHNMRRYLTMKRYEEQRLVKLLDDSTENLNSEEDQMLPKNTDIGFNYTLPEPHSLLLDETKRNQVLSSFHSRTVGSWFDPLEMNSDEFTPQAGFTALGSKQMTFNLTRGHISPLVLLMGNYNIARKHRQPGTADKQNLTVQTVNRSSAILSRRDIEKVNLFMFSSVLDLRSSLYYYLRCMAERERKTDTEVSCDKAVLSSDFYLPM